MEWRFTVLYKNWSMIIHSKLLLESYQNWIWYDSIGNEWHYEYHYFSLQCLDNHLTIIMWDVQNPVSTLHEILLTYENLCTRLYSSKVATTLLQPRNFHMGYTFIQAKLIYRIAGKFDKSTLFELWAKESLVN